MNRLVGLIFLCIFASVNSTLLGAKECTYGPSYWCTSLENAKSCGAVSHCITSVWEKKVLPKDKGDICTICKDMVMQAREQLESKENQELLKQVFEGSCQLIPIKEVQKECMKYVDQFIPELIEILASQMNPQIVCATINLCNSAKVNMLMKKYDIKQNLIVEPKEKAPAAKNCDDCEKFISDVRNLVLSYSREELLHKMLQVCGRLDSLADGCKAIVEVNFAAIYNYLKHHLDSKQACELFGFCGRIYGGHVKKMSHKTGDEICDFCETIIQHFKDNLASNTSKAQFKEILEGMCHSTGHFAQECLSIVDQYYELIYNLLLSEVDAQKICEVVGLCGPSSVFKNDFSTWTLFNIRPADHLPMIPLEESYGENSINSNRFNIKKPRQSNPNKDIDIIPLGTTGIFLHEGEKKQDNACIMCEFVLHFLQDFLQQKHTREEIKAELDKVCSYLPHTVSEQCQDYVDAYGDQVLEFLDDEMDPSTVCPMLHLCPSATSLLSMKSSDLCVTCEFVVNIIDELLSNNVMQIEKSLKLVCKVFPSSVRSVCEGFIVEYGQVIISYLEKEISPDKICTLLNLCKPVIKGTNYGKVLLHKIDEPTLKKSTPSFKQSTECILCEFILHELDNFLLYPSTQEKVSSAVERVCLILPNSIQSDCLSFLEKYSMELIDRLVERINPDLICSHIKVCKQTIHKEMPVAYVLHPHVRKHKRVLLGSEKCTWGPGYWCHSKLNAEYCKATQHCIDHVWENGKP